MSFTDTAVLATAWLKQPALGQRQARTLLVGAATLAIRHRFGGWSFMLEAHSTTVTDNPAETILWLAEDLATKPSRLVPWRAEDIVIPSMIAAAETAGDGLAGIKLLREFERAYTREVEDAAQPFGTKATSFDAIAHEHGLPFIAMSRRDLEEAHRTGNHGAIREHLAARVKATWQLWLRNRPDSEALIAETETWLATPDAQVKL